MMTLKNSVLNLYLKESSEGIQMQTAPVINSIQLSKLNKKKISMLAPESDNARLVKLWETSTAETTAEGIVYKVTPHPFVTDRVAVCIGGFNQPLILVSSLLDKKERQIAARHEMAEFKGIGHDRIVKKENLKLRKKLLEKQTKIGVWPRRIKH